MLAIRAPLAFDGERMADGALVLGDWRDTVLAWRAGAAQDLPSVVASGTPITSTGGHCWALGGEAAGERALRAAVQQRAEAGADVVKIMASGGVFTPGTDTTGLSSLTPRWPPRSPRRMPSGCRSPPTRMP